MVVQPPLRSLHVTGFASLADTTINLSSPVTLLVGANGAGKSNVVEAFELLGRVVDGQLNEYVLRRGGFDALLNVPRNPAETQAAIFLDVEGEQHDGRLEGYQAQIMRSAEAAALVEETVSWRAAAGYDPYTEPLGVSRESRLRERADEQGIARFVLDLVSGCRVFHFDDTSPDAPPKQFVDGADSLTLAPDARNVAAVLLRMRTADEKRYRRLLRAVQTVAPFFADFVLRPETSGLLRLRWREKGRDRVFSADALSDGTLRFVCLAVLLLQPEPPQTIVLDEPELGLHPFAVHQLAALLRGAARDRRIVAATQSVTLLSQFSVDDVAIVERGPAGTVVWRPDPEGLADWLDEYSLGELWEKNLLGGRPRPDERLPAQA